MARSNHSTELASVDFFTVSTKKADRTTAATTGGAVGHMVCNEGSWPDRTGPFPLTFYIAGLAASMITLMCSPSRWAVWSGEMLLSGQRLKPILHFHMLFLDGVYLDGTHGSRARFRWVNAPTSDELTQLTHTIAQRVARYLERQGLLVRDAGNSYLTADGMDADLDSPMNQLLGS